MLVVGKLNWMHVPATATLTWIGCHPNLERIAHVRALHDEILRALRLTLEAGGRYARPDTWPLRMTGPLTCVGHGQDRELPPGEHHMPRTAICAGVQHSVHHAAGYGTFDAAVARASSVA
jgi:hypothetical protein